MSESINNSFTVIHPGILSLLQDSGRFGKHNIGLTNGGPLDKLSFDWANRLLGNEPNACVIEVSIGGLVLQSNIDTQIAITGGNAEITINNATVPSWQTHLIKAGDKISFGFAKTASRHYLAVKNGFQLEAMFGSCSTVVREKLGGLDGSALQAGDSLACFPIDPTVLNQYRVKQSDRPTYVDNTDSYADQASASHKVIELRVVLGYQHESFNHLDKTRFFTNEFTISDKCDRMGFRLTGPEIKSSISEMLSEGICYGAIQIPADGQPIILLNDRQTIGGYPKIGSVLSLDIPKLTQRLPGTKLTFRAIDIDEAQCELHLAYYRYKHAIVESID